MKTMFCKIQCIFLFILLTTSAVGQVYHPVLNTDRVWQVRSTNFNGSGVEHWYDGHTLGDSVVINNYTYYHFDFIPEDVVVREDTTLKQLFLYDIANDIEYVSFDFSLSVGDTLPENFAVLSYGGEFIRDSLAIVESIDSVFMTDGSPRKRFHIVSQDNIVFSGLVMIEGLGGPLGFISPTPLEFETSYTLLAVKENDDIIYGSWFYISVQEEVESSIEIYPNPVMDKLSVKSEYLNHISIYNILGDKVYESSELSSDHSIDFTLFNSGIYLVKGSDKSDETLFIKKIVKR